MSLKRGRLIVIEGCDGAGKTTLFNQLKEVFPGYEYLTFPDRTTEKGKQLDEILQGKQSLSKEEKHRLFTDNRWELQDTIKEFLYDGISVICDRYSHSGVAYSMAGGLSKEWCLEQEKGLLKPDVVIFLDVDPKTCKGRIKNRGGKKEITEKFKFQVLVYQSYHELQEDNWYMLEDYHLNSAVDICKKTTTMQKSDYF